MEQQLLQFQLTHQSEQALHNILEVGAHHGCVASPLDACGQLGQGIADLCCNVRGIIQAQSECLQ